MPRGMDQGLQAATHLWTTLKGPIWISAFLITPGDLPDSHSACVWSNRRLKPCAASSSANSSLDPKRLRLKRGDLHYGACGGAVHFGICSFPDGIVGVVAGQHPARRPHRLEL